MNDTWGESSERADSLESRDNKLVQAVTRQSMEDLKMLILAKVCLCQQDRNGMTALMHAAAQGSMPMTCMLVEHEKGLKDNDGKMALHHALRGGHVDVARLLLPHEDPRDRNGVTALMRASAIGDMEMVVPLVNLQGAVQTISGGSYELASGVYSFNKGTTALMFAAWYGQNEAVRALVDCESKMQDNGRLTALMYAAERGYVEVVGELKSRECKMWNWLGRTALMFAARNGHTDVAKLLLEDEKQMLDGNGWTALMYAASNGHAEIAYLMLDHEKCIQDNDGWTALMFAAYYGHTDMIGLLLNYEKGLKDSKGRTALMHATERGNVEAVKLLIEHEACAQTNAQYTALMLAAYANCVETAKVLVHYEGGMQTADGWTALMEAATRGHTEVAAILVHFESRMHRDDGCTALICAAYERQEELVRLLFSYEGTTSGWTELMYAATLGLTSILSNHLDDAGQQDNSGLTALMYAVRNCRAEVVKVLVASECGFQDGGGWSALMHAVSCGYRELINYLLPEAGCQSISTHLYHPPGTTALMIAAQQNDAYTVELLISLEAGFLDSNNNCALAIALQNASSECIPLLFRELHVLDSHGKACYFRLHTLNKNGFSEFMLLCDYLQETIQMVFFSQLKREALMRLFTAIICLIESSTVTDPLLLELVWAALFCEHDNVITDLDNQLILIEDACTEDTCTICLVRPPDCVLLPCRHLVICLACADSIYADELHPKCPYCRTGVKTMFGLEDCPSP
ncbi:Protein 21.1 [Giardia duodenalis ATCC 50581]|uniref:Protein 21.1 n=1 Tax=Giardia intestinalis (strain ATCC 50581 / GS clone H7) TaxID=598745 RepID=C6LSU4_GIAIB|nr:Protein 21.1 [Giardia intestinalis ATCC 50581]